MNAPLKLGLYGAGLVALFAASFAVAGAIVPANASAGWNDKTEESAMEHGTEEQGGHAATTSGAASVPGLALEQNGYQLREVTAPGAAASDGSLSFRLTGPDGAGVTGYDVEHDKELHLIVVRSDGAEFRHVHPENLGDGRWSLPWAWQSAGSYRVFADFAPSALGEGITLTSTVSVAGDLVPRATPEPNSIATVGDLTVELDGSLIAGESSSLSFTVTRVGEDVTTLEPYLGAFGHLVALREGDLGYLHVHPMGEPSDGKTEPGPQIDFMAQAPTAGTYFLYLDFQIDGEVHTAEFVVTASAPTTHGSSEPQPSEQPAHSEH